jgi:hypothetical protein
MDRSQACRRFRNHPSNRGQRQATRSRTTVHQRGNVRPRARIARASTRRARAGGRGQPRSPLYEPHSQGVREMGRSSNSREPTGQVEAATANGARTALSRASERRRGRFASPPAVEMLQEGRPGNGARRGLLQVRQACHILHPIVGARLADATACRTGLVSEAVSTAAD